MSQNYAAYLYLSQNTLIGKMKSEQKEKNKATSLGKFEGKNIWLNLRTKSRWSSV